MKHPSSLKPLLAGFALLLFAVPASAQEAGQAAQPVEDEPIRVGEGVTQAIPIAVPYMPTPAAAETPAGNTQALGRQVADIVAADLRYSGLFTPIGPGGLPAVSFPQVSAPDYPAFAPSGAQNLVHGFVQANPNGSLTVGCYLYDISGQTH